MTPRQMNVSKAMASIALAALAVGSCGQKPAPAETPAAAAAAGSSAAMAAGAARNGAQSMRVTRVEKRDMADEIVANGRLVVREEAAVGTELAGYRIAAVYVDEGDWVKAGQPLAKMDDTLLQAQIAQAEATLATQKANADFKQSQLERSQTLAKQGALPQAQLEQSQMEAASAKASLMASQAAVNEMKVREGRMTLRAPVSGMILQRSLRPGDISGAVQTTPYFRIARDGLVELDAELPDVKLAQVKEGEPATVTLPTGETIQGKVRFVSPRVDQATNLGRARIEMPFNKALRAGSFAEAHLAGTSRNALVVLAGAVRYEAGGASLMVVDDGNKVHRTPVKLGQRMGDYVQLTEGPPAGSRVLATGAAFTLDGDVIQPVEDGVASAAAAPGGK